MFDQYVYKAVNKIELKTLTYIMYLRCRILHF